MDIQEIRATLDRYWVARMAHDLKKAHDNDAMISSVICASFTIIFLIVVSSVSFVNAQVTITPGTVEPEPELEPEQAVNQVKFFKHLTMRTLSR